MFNQLTALGWGIVTFAIVIGIGTIVLQKFGDSVATCTGVQAYNASNQKCYNITSGDDLTDPVNAGWVNTNYLGGQLGSSGLAGWTPAIIALSIGLLFLGAFLMNKGKGRSY
jgi:hypothetical protein